MPRSSSVRGKGRRNAKQEGGQLAFDDFTPLFQPYGWGGMRENSGPRPKPGAGVPHLPRVPLDRETPVHVSQHLAQGLPSLRQHAEYFTFLDVIDELHHEREDFRVCDEAALSNHFHLLAEADDAGALSSAMQSLKIRLTLCLNSLWGRKGSIFDDRYEVEPIHTAPHAHDALLYVLNNARHHGVWRNPLWPDPYSSGAFFERWTDRRITVVTGTPKVILPPRSRLLAELEPALGGFPVAAVPPGTGSRRSRSRRTARRRALARRT